MGNFGSDDFRRALMAGIKRGSTDEQKIEVTKRGELCVIDFYTEAALEGWIYQVRAGTISVPLVGDVVLTDAAAEFCADASAALTIIPIEVMLAVNLGTGTLHEYAVKSVGAVSTVGTAFVPLPLKLGGVAAIATARVAAAGGVTVTAELDTTTRQHAHWANPVAVGAGNDAAVSLWTPRCPPVLTGAACCYVQVAATTTGPSYFGHLDFIQRLTEDI